MNRRSFLRNAVGVLAGALGAGWLWSRCSREPEQAALVQRVIHTLGLGNTPYASLSAKDQALVTKIIKSGQDLFDNPPITFKGVPVTYSPTLDDRPVLVEKVRDMGATVSGSAQRADILNNWKEDPVCAILQNHFAKRVWPPYTVDVHRYFDVFDVAISVVDHRNQTGGWVNHIAIAADEIVPGHLVDSSGAAVSRVDKKFDDAFKALRLWPAAEGFTQDWLQLMTGVQA